ncbi:ATP-binding protein [Sphingobacterium spiritivorum]|uniref:sensor histidine kinase n=1 Tax=Sphingobacterium spiritivorum TaxID=258 RepID=UPI003DA48563
MNKSISIYLVSSILCIFLLFVSHICSAQSAIDEAEIRYKKAVPESTEQLMLAGKYAQTLFFNNRQEEAFRLLEKNIRVAEKKKDGQYAAYLNSIAAMNSRILNNKTASDQYIKKAKHYANETSDIITKGYVIYCEGWLQVRDEQEALAVKSFQNALTLLDKAPDTELVLNRKTAIYKELCTIYSNWKAYDLQKQYAEKTLEVAKIRQDPMSIFDAYMLMGYMYEQQHKENRTDQKALKAAEEYYLSAINTYQQQKNKMAIPSDLSFAAINLANLYMEFYPDSYKEKSLNYAKMALEKGKETHQYTHVAAAYGILSEFSLQANKRDEAKDYLLASLAALMKENFIDQGVAMSLFQKLTELYEEEGDYKQAIHYYKQYIAAFEAVYNTEKMEQGRRLEAQFEKERQKQLLIQMQLQADKKEQQLSLMHALSGQQMQQLENMKLNEENQRQQLEVVQLEAEKRGQELRLSRLETQQRANELFSSKQQLDYKTRINTFYFLLVCAFFISALLLLYAYRQRSKTLKQNENLHLLELAREKQNSKISNLTAMLEGQEAERSRLARDLHDGLGGLLSGTKIGLSRASEKAEKPELKTAIKSSLDQIDIAVQELRRVAHNLMPELLIKYGLQETITEYTERMSGEKLEVSAVFVNCKTQLNQERQILVYRIIQELVNNAIKHAEASQIIVQLSENDNRLHITVEDDGKGFDPQKLNGKKSAGMHNVETRLSFLKGKINIHSQHNIGTTIELDFPLDPNA